VVTEYIYPTDFRGDTGNGTDTGRRLADHRRVVEPSSFETREVGVILSVLPEVSPDSQMISLTMTPEVVSEPTWKNYGTQFTDPNGKPAATQHGAAVLPYTQHQHQHHHL